ncbi:MAG: DUF3307 domain-containing protein [Balneolaceae bacterium]
MIVLLKLLLAHIIGDFFLQTLNIVREKEQKKLRSPHLYLHSFLHGVLPFLLIWDLSFWKFALLIFISHLIIDAIKLYAQNSRNQASLFFLDQTAHILVILFIWNLMMPGNISFAWLQTSTFLLAVVALLFLTLPSSIITRVIISRWTPHTEDDDSESLVSAGKYIGILERLFVFGFVVTGQLQAIGFLIAAKSVFRFGDLRNSKNRKLTEYILIGTLVSFGIAMLTGLAYRMLGFWT